MWKPVLGYEGKYEASDSGEIKRIGAGRGVKPNRILKQSNHKQGYKAVGLHRDNLDQHLLVHRVVYEAFNGPIPPGFEINHKDGSKINNHISNLECVTRTVNIRHAMNSGLINNDGENNPMAKLTNEIVREVKRLYKPKEVGYKKVGQILGIKWESVRDIIKERKWKSITI